jgi:hypothetical protein
LYETLLLVGLVFYVTTLYQFLQVIWYHMTEFVSAARVEQREKGWHRDIFNINPHMIIDGRNLETGG